MVIGSLPEARRAVPGMGDVRGRRARKKEVKTICYTSSIHLSRPFDFMLSYLKFINFFQLQ